MIYWDSENKQIMTSLCRSCPDDYFAPYSQDLQHVGCCSYSPVFSLYEIWKMVKSGKREFFIKRIYENADRTLAEYEVVVHAYVHNSYEHITRDQFLSKTELTDWKLKFSVCQFFVEGKGCGLDPYFKNSVCRSFICSAVEEQLGNEDQDHLKEWVRLIRLESETFNEHHKKILHRKAWSLEHHMPQILDYLQTI
ncbi:hypothetical protein [Ammoniphilus sp. CFH 90114]|uniref:hypothetical protein n=1 Tax=Ammoniphilus sp. CFH 90114 TaxID=2493665 RepID=UPI00100DD635|nr:hypothetical protein [Ammoniphilus sp. CFH 90114]RXT04812.1 hypothetical protein EIZ39_18975 [Ammoniphilus sp. CFH 90114]